MPFVDRGGARTPGVSDVHGFRAPGGRRDSGRGASMDEPGTAQSTTDFGGDTPPLDDPQPSALESLLRRVARTPAEEDLARTEELGPGVVVAGRFEVVR